MQSHPPLVTLINSNIIILEKASLILMISKLYYNELYHRYFMVERLFMKAFLLNFDDKYIVSFGPLKYICLYIFHQMYKLLRFPTAEPTF